MKKLLCALVTAALLNGCGGGGEDLDDLAERLEVETQVSVVDVEEIRAETDEDLSIENGLDDADFELLAGFALLPFLQVRRLPELIAFEDMRGYVATPGEIVFRFDLSADEMRERLDEMEFESDGENRYVAGADFDSVERNVAPAVGIAEDGGGVLVAVGKDQSVVDRLLNDGEEGEDLGDLLDLDSDAAVRHLFPEGLGKGECRLKAVTQEITGDRMVTVYLDDAEGEDLSKEIEKALRGEIESIDEVDDLLAIRVKPEQAGLRTSGDILVRFGSPPICD